MSLILVVDDSRNIRDMVARYLEGEGFRVMTAADGREALDTAASQPPDLLVLDIMMPGMDGFEFLRRFRTTCDAPVVVLSAKVDEHDKVTGLDLGADDYLTKPFGMRELSARIRANLRRGSRRGEPAETIAAGEVELDRGARVARVRGASVDLTPSEALLLARLMTAAGKPVSRLDLQADVQGSVFAGSERTVDVHIRNLRGKIEVDPAKPTLVRTVYGLGYRFDSTA
jgi:DNA-binding response OmpR family regulator